MSGKLLAENVVTGYARREVVRGVSLEARAGEITCVFGPNGSGKSTLIKAIAGAIPIWQGTVRLNGTELSRLPVHKVVRQGVVMMAQGGGVFPRLSVRDNLRMGGYAVPDQKEVERRIDHLLEQFPALQSRRKIAAGNLSGGEQMMVAIARVLVSDPAFVLLDEPSAGLAPAMVHETLERVRALKDRGIGVVMVEQNIREALPVADRLYILVAGREQFHGTPSDIEGDAQLMKLYMGA
jgi:branched-chain amino acid transport system ATP-binding protein